MKMVENTITLNTLTVIIKGIHEFAYYEDAINYQKGKHIEKNKRRNPINEEILNYLQVYEYDQPIFSCTMC